MKTHAVVRVPDVSATGLGEAGESGETPEAPPDVLPESVAVAVDAMLAATLHEIAGNAPGPEPASRPPDAGIAAARSVLAQENLRREAMLRDAAMVRSAPTDNGASTRSRSTKASNRSNSTKGPRTAADGDEPDSIDRLIDIFVVQLRASLLPHLRKASPRSNRHGLTTARSGISATPEDLDVDTVPGGQGSVLPQRLPPVEVAQGPVERNAPSPRPITAIRPEPALPRFAPQSATSPPIQDRQAGDGQSQDETPPDTAPSVALSDSRSIAEVDEILPFRKILHNARLETNGVDDALLLLSAAFVHPSTLPALKRLVPEPVREVADNRPDDVVDDNAVAPSALPAAQPEDWFITALRRAICASRTMWPAAGRAGTRQRPRQARLARVHQNPHSSDPRCSGVVERAAFWVLADTVSTHRRVADATSHRIRRTGAIRCSQRVAAYLTNTTNCAAGGSETCRQSRHLKKASTTNVEAIFKCLTFGRFQLSRFSFIRC